jgi:hypothetical protein
MTTDKMSYKMIHHTSIQLHTALKITYYFRGGDASSENSMLRILKDWQESGLFCAHSYYNYPQGSKTPSNLLELEFLEQIVVTAPRFFIVAGILDGFSIGPLIDAIPVLLRAAVDGSPGAMTDPRCWDLVGYILTRLTNTSSEKRQGVSSQARASVRNATLLLHSWFVIQCLFTICTEKISDWQVVLDLLDRFRNTLSSTDNWEYPFILSIEEEISTGVCPRPMGLYFYYFGSHITVAVVNFVTAYRILGRLVQDRLRLALITQAPQGKRERFEMVLIGGEENWRGCSDEAFLPVADYYDDIGTQPLKTWELRKEAWELYLQSKSSDLTLVDDGMGYCIRELAKRGFEFPHSWNSNWTIEERS